jgi:hypothetical protein
MPLSTAPTIVHRPTPTTRAITIWSIVAQIGVLALTALALWWSPAPDRPRQLLLVLVALGLVIIALKPAWRGGAIAGMLAGSGCALACWLSTLGERMWEMRWLESPYIPLIAPYVAGTALVLTIWGCCIRAPLRRNGRIGNAALAAMAILIAYALAFFLVINHRAPYNTFYAVDRYQLEELVAVAILYPTACWLADISLPSPAPRIGLPVGMAILLIGFVLFWQRL